MSFDVDAARGAVRGGTWSRAIDIVTSSGPPLEVAKAFHALGKALYWKDKDLIHARRVLEEGIEYAKATDADEGAQGVRKAMNYDLASFCWPGWDEALIEITEDDVTAGERAADENLRMAVALSRGDAPMANAHFMVGAYRLSRRRMTDALISFAHFRSHASASQDVASTRLADGYLALTEWLNGDEDAEETFVGIVDRLKASTDKNEVYFAQQLQTAAKVVRGR